MSSELLSGAFLDSNTSLSLPTLTFSLPLYAAINYYFKHKPSLQTFTIPLHLRKHYLQS